jgi:DUF4097 and DUF4098 domain-containing protein YvlB
MFRRYPLTAAFAVVVLCLAGGASWAGQDWKEVADPDELMIDEAFQLRPDARLHVEVSDVHVELRHGDDGVAWVKVYASARDQDRAREYFDDLHMKVEKDDNTVKVQTARSMFRMSRPWNWSSRVRVYAIISVPRGTDMRVRTDDGDIRAERLVGELDARTSDGDIQFGDLEGPSVRIRTSDGDIVVEDINAEKVELRSSDGDVRAGKVDGDELTFSTSDGDIVAASASGGEVYMSSSDGDITVDRVEGDKMRARTSDGDIEVTLAGALELDLRSSDGDIRIGAPRGLDADIYLSGERVRLGGGIDIDGEISRTRARGKIGRGGVEVSARASDGTVSLDLE